VCLHVARDCDHMTVKRRAEITKDDAEVGELLGTMLSMPEKSCPVHQKIKTTEPRFLHSVFRLLKPVFRSIVDTYKSHIIQESL
jgi:hypothetical protein